MWPLGLKLQLLQSLVISVSANVCFRLHDSMTVSGTVPSHDRTGMPAVLPVLSDSQHLLPDLVGQRYDSVVLSGDSLNSLASIMRVVASFKLQRWGAHCVLLLRILVQLLGLLVCKVTTAIGQQRRLLRRQLADLARLPTQLANCRCGGCGGVRLPRPATM
jgi:hypothetical protein